MISYRSQAKFLVIVQDSVHVLDPDGVHRPIEEHPLQVGIVLLDADADEHAENPVLPLMSVLIELTVQLTHRDGLRIQMINLLSSKKFDKFSR